MECEKNPNISTKNISVNTPYAPAVSNVSTFNQYDHQNYDMDTMDTSYIPNADLLSTSKVQPVFHENFTIVSPNTKLHKMPSMTNNNSNNLFITNSTNAVANHPIYCYNPPQIPWLINTCSRVNIPFHYSVFEEVNHVEDLFFYRPDKIIKTIGDGHCGFYTLSILLTGTPNYHPQLRAIIANHVISSPIKLEEFVWWEDARHIAYNDLETDTTNPTNNWMRSIHLAAAANLFQCNILVKCRDRYGWECYNFTTFNFGRNNTIFQSELPCLLIDNSSGNHFEPVITVKKII